MTAATLATRPAAPGFATRPAAPGFATRPDGAPGFAATRPATPGFTATRVNARVQVMLLDRRTRRDAARADASLTCRWYLDADGRLAVAWACDPGPRSP